MQLIQILKGINSKNLAKCLIYAAYVLGPCLLLPDSAWSEGYYTTVAYNLDKCYATQYAACAGERFNLPADQILAKPGNPYWTCCHRYPLHQGGDCNGNFRISSIRPCTLQFYCQSPYILSYSNGTPVCEARCAETHFWDNNLKECVAKHVEHSCKDQTPNPIDLATGSKYRKEHVITVGNRFPMVLTYFYNSHQAREKLANGTVLSFYDPTKPADSTTVPMTHSEYVESYTELGLPKNGYFRNDNQYLGHLNRYWRHSYDDVLLDRSTTAGFYIYSQFSGIDVRFDTAGKSLVYPYLSLKVMDTSDTQTLGFGGHKIINGQSNITRYFDERGRLRRISDHQGGHQWIEYDASDTIHRIVSSSGYFLKFLYQGFAKDSTYNLVGGNEYYLVAVIDQAGRKVDLEWGQHVSGQLIKQRMLTRLTHEYSDGSPSSGRDFEYRQVGFQGAITSIFDVEDVGNNFRIQHAFFKYDLGGRAILSQLGTDQERVSVEYPNDYQRILMNVFGKSTVFNYQDVDGVKRLKSVVGEPTENCLSSAAEFSYDSAGNILSKLLNNQTVVYQYDNFNREISRTEAAGTPQARTIVTEYHSSLNQPVKITEPGLIVEMTYDTAGRLLNTKRTATAAPSP